MNTKQSRLQEVNRHEVDIEIIECSSFGSVHRTSRGESQTRGWLNLPNTEVMSSNPIRTVNIICRRFLRSSESLLTRRLLL